MNSDLPRSERAKRRWWVAAVLAFLFTPLAFAYLGRGRRALAYAAAYFLPYVSAALFAMANLREAARLAPMLSLAVVIAAIIDAIRLARRSPRPFAGPWFSRWHGVTAIALLWLLPIMLVRSFLYEPFRIPSGAMAPGLIPGDYIITSKWGYGNYGTFGIHFRGKRAKKAMRGEVIVFRYPPDTKVDYIKRVIGIPGDTVSYQDKKLFINGKEVTQHQVALSEQGVWDPTLQTLEENLDGHRYLILVSPSAPPVLLDAVRPDTKRSCRYTEAGFDCVVPQNHYFMLGDNRDQTSDSRYWGMVPSDHIVGKARLRAWRATPTSPADTAWATIK